ncbi:GGDEF domain-containing protein [Desulfurispira natronophila]|uniref:diguanylate cyclase n=1 Tax=Desulfurispira natronophila TaxID=682562 RepID=A0A7W7Y619_9BACT|nr:GGDEF domain-containing protein [Desulfurispira natronophila]MBB5022760.1 diguanylate cyclase [Desulfurispira natronophila]
MGKYQHLSGNISTITRQALTRLSKEQLPATPDYYAIFFEYYAGLNPELKHEVDSADQLNEQVLDNIFTSYFATPSEVNTTLQRESQQMIERIFNTLSNSLDIFGEERQNKLFTLRQQVQCGQIRVEDAVDILSNEVSSVAEEYRQMRTALQESMQNITQLKKQYHKLGQQSRKDYLTRLYNRQALEEFLQNFISDRQRQPFAVTVLDIDNFKPLNDTYGHLTGDKVLKELAVILESQSRQEDFVFRYGGEEFVVLMPRTNLAAAFQVAEHLRRSISMYDFGKANDGRKIGPVTASMGVAAHIENDSCESLLARADDAMYQSKNRGKNRVTLASKPHP